MGALEGRVALVTGGASGIGRAVVQRLALEGASVVVVDVDDQGGKEAAAEVAGRFEHLDVASPDAWRELVAVLERDLGGLDVVHLNAGVTTQEGDITKVTDAQYRRVVGVNVDGVVFGLRATAPALERRGGGVIVATASLAGIIAFAPDPLYTLTKHAVVGLVRSVAPQLQSDNVRINAVCPGIVDTPLAGPAREHLREAGFPLIPPDDIASAVLACVEGRFETGACLVCQAGRPPEPYQFHDVPGPRAAGAIGRRPPGV